MHRSQARTVRQRLARAHRRKEPLVNLRTVDEPTLPVPNVLIVDDDDDIRSLMSALLRRDGYSVIEASNGAEAERAALNRTPQLILMDIGMPGQDGLSTVWRIREHPEIANVPVVIISAYDSFDLRAEAAAEGCRGYLAEPFDPEELSALVREILQPWKNEMFRKQVTDEVRSV
jgi:CheY-like chemotaxis protein